MKSLYNQVFTILLVVAAAGLCRAQEGIETKPVRFAAGTSSSNTTGTLVGYQIIDYTLGAKAGQTMSVHLKTDHTANYFNVLPPGTEQAIFIGSTNGNEFTGPLPVDGVYRVRVYLMRSAARREEKANFSISFSITGAPGSTDAKVAGTPYHATGKVPCSVGPDPKGSAQCEFGVIRKGAGQAEVHVSTPGGEKRILIFDGNKVECPDPEVKLQAGYINYNYEISINDFEFFTIPEAVINGG